MKDSGKNKQNHKSKNDKKENVKKENVKKETVKETIKNIEVEEKPKRYISYNVRLIINSCFLLLCLLLVALLFNYSIRYQKEKTVSYTENGVADYRVWLKANSSFPGLKYLGKQDLDNHNYAYVTSLIDKIEIDKKSNIDFDYNIVGELLIFDSDGKNVFYSENYNLLDKKTKKMENANDINIKETISLDYDKYNSIANNFKNLNGLDTVSYLKVSLIVHKQNSNNEKEIKLGENKEISVTIPLSKRSIIRDGKY